MSLWSKTLSLVTGVDLEAEQQRSNTIDAQSAVTNQQLVERGFYTQQEADDSNKAIAEANQRNGTADVVGSVTDAFDEGLKEGAHNVLKFPGDVVGGVGSGLSELLGGVLKNIPWWAYVVGLGALFVWMGGLSLLRGRFAR